jgi:hypothetical protein
LEIPGEIWQENMKGMGLEIHGSIIVVSELAGRLDVCTALISFRIAISDGLFKHGNELTCSIKFQLIE